jgi:hypothetical protein
MGKELRKGAPGPPAIADYSPEAANKAVRTATLNHPITLYSTVIGVLGALSLGILGPSIYATAAAFGGFSLGIGSWVVNYFFRSETLAKRYLDRLDQQREQHKSWLIEQVKAGLSCRYATEAACSQAKQGCEQFDRARLVRDGIQELLGMKLGVNELTFHQFLAATEQAYLSTLDNLKDVVAILRSADSITPGTLEQRLLDMKGKNLSQADKEEQGALTESLALWHEQMDKVDKMLAKNERVITEMENISARVADWDTEQHFAASDVESIITELQDLAGYARKITQNPDSYTH